MFRPFLFTLCLLIAAVASGLAGCGGPQLVTKTNPIDGKSLRPYTGTPVPQGRRGKVMVRVPAGEFRMGTTVQEQSDLAAKFKLQAALFGSESPQEAVSLAEFYIDQTPVTNDEYKKFLDANPDQGVPFLTDAIAQSLDWDKTKRTFPEGREQYPAVLVTWQEANVVLQVGGWAIAKRGGTGEGCARHRRAHLAVGQRVGCRQGEYGGIESAGFDAGRPVSTGCESLRRARYGG